MSEYNKVYVYNLLKDKGYNENTIAALMGNIDVETGGTFNFQEEQKGGSGYGLFQFEPNGGKMPYYKKWLETNGYEDSAESQVDFMHDSIYEGFQVPNSKGDIVDMVGGGNRTNLQNVFEEGSREEITDLFEKRWEIPNPAKAHSERRLESAINFNADELPHIASAAFADTISPYVEQGMGWLKESDQHNVETGDNVYDISKKYGMSIDELQALNPDYNITENQIFAGKPLKVGTSWYDKIDDLF